MGYNRILTDKDREDLKQTIATMYAYVPEMSGNKIASAIVQQAFVYNTVGYFTMEHLFQCPRILSAGSYQDTAAELLRFAGYAVYDVDPVINCDLRTFVQRVNTESPLFKGYDIVMSTSVLEHTSNDEEFIEDICKLLIPDGIAILTCDFKDDWIVGQPVPYTSNRFYTCNDLEVRLRNILRAHNCDLIDEPDYTEKDTFIWDGINYSFATYVFRKEQ